jgi:large subunit ribosomal protein L4e
VFSSEDGTKKSSTVTLPGVFLAPIRDDVVNFVHTNMRKNKRQPYAPADNAGGQTSAISWGTGRAVARIPRVSGGGTGRSGQGAYGNMCRGGRMFAPNKIWRHWHRRINQNQRRFATASAIAASALPALVQARGHRVSHIGEIPVVVDDGIEKLQKTKDAVRLLKQLGVYTDVEKSAHSRKIRTGQGKLRNRRHVQRRGPLVVFNKDEGIHKAFRNLPGVNLVRVDGLNLLQLAPGGHLGRLIVWSQSAFKRLDAVFGTHRVPSAEKSGYHLPRSTVTIPDLARLLKSNEIQSVIRPRIARPKKAAAVHNPLTNVSALIKLNPYAATFKRLRTLASTKAVTKAAPKAVVAAPKKAAAAPKKDGKKK